ncbi:MAG: DNA recombination protein RmuC [Ignavibacteria bacterium]
MEMLFIAVGLVIGVLVTFLFVKNKYQGEAIKLTERNTILDSAYREQKTGLDNERELTGKLKTENARLDTAYKNLETKLEEQKKEIELIQQKFTAEFENLANKIFEEKSQKFSTQNKTNLEEILTPLRENIKDFENRVNEVYVSESKERASLTEQLKSLHELNKQMSEEANNLTRALKGDTQKQGAWGEFILEKILENSGLVKDREYIVQTSFTNEQGRRQRPDVIINLPENKHIVIDSKVSLTAYEAFCSEDKEENRKKLLADHGNSVRIHIKELFQKSYQNIYGIDSLDFVLMFIPIEPAFALAVQNNPGVFDEAFDKNIVIVSPSTLLATLRTIANIWKQEKQNVNALEIAKQSGDLYDKFVAFIEDMIEMGKKLNSAKEYYGEAMKKLTEGKGNLVLRTEKLKELGVKTNKSLPANLVERALDNGNLFEGENDNS